MMFEAIKQYLVGTVIPPIVGGITTWLAGTKVLVIFGTTTNAASGAITKVLVFLAAAGLAWLAQHHILSGHYSPSAKAANASTAVPVVNVNNAPKA
jgi:hypothetical protein